LRTRGLEQRAVTDGTVADADGSRLERELRRGGNHGAALHPREHLAPAGVDHGDGSGRTRCERVEGRDPRHGEVEGEGEPPDGRKADADAGEAARSDADRERVEIGWAKP